MRTAILALLVALAGVMASEPALARGRGHGHISFGLHFGPYWGPWWYYPPPYYYYPHYPASPAQPTMYIEQGSAPAAEGGWWYYCDQSRGYYPYVRECPTGWQRVPPTPPPAK